MKYLFLCMALLSSSVILFMIMFLGYFSIPMLENGGFLKMIFSEWNPPDSFGLYPMVLGSLFLSILSTFFAFLYSICIALYAESFKSKKLFSAIRYIFSLISSIPTVVYGFLGVIVLVPILRDYLGGSGMNLLGASLMLSLVITPTMTLFFLDSFNNLPKEYRVIVSSLGGDRVDYQMRILLFATKESLLVGFIMGFARALGDTMIALMIAGNATLAPSSLLDSIRTLTSHIALMFAGDFESMEFRSIFASGFILFLISLLMIFSARFLRTSHAR